MKMTHRISPDGVVTTTAAEVLSSPEGKAQLEAVKAIRTGLPEPDRMNQKQGFGPPQNYSSDQMREYGRACEKAALKDAAELCDRFAERQMHPAECAAAIRKLGDSK